VLNPRLDHLPDYAFPRLRTLLGATPPGDSVIDMSIGEPQEGVPRFVTDILSRDPELYGKYPPIGGTAEWGRAAAGWLRRRYGLTPEMLTPEAHILPLNGTREGLFSIAFVTIPPEKGGAQPAVLLPNPFYQCYGAAALAAGAEPVYVTARAENNWLPDFAGVGEETLARTSLVYLCSPSNPHGTTASLDYLTRMITLARARGFVLLVDECYSEIYGETPPPGALEACRLLAEKNSHLADNPFANVLVFHSLSKRSSLPGLRSGFVAGDPRIIADFRRFRSYVGPASPLPVYAAAAAAWSDENHVAENRRQYRAKFDDAERILGKRFAFYRPAGGFFLWLDVGDGEAAALKLWREGGVKVVPGGYLARADATGHNPGSRYIRVALVATREATAEGLKRLARILEGLNHREP
jgi:aspartate/methionine/tyrosine aminotransferase